jgi:hypothetical protein
MSAVYDRCSSPPGLGARRAARRRQAAAQGRWSALYGSVPALLLPLAWVACAARDPELTSDQRKAAAAQRDRLARVLATATLPERASVVEAALAAMPKPDRATLRRLFVDAGYDENAVEVAMAEGLPPMATLAFLEHVTVGAIRQRRYKAAGPSPTK